jgi:hypothetical protein
MKKHLLILPVLLACLGCKLLCPHSHQGGSIAGITFLGWLSENISTSVWTGHPAGQTAYYDFWIQYDGDFTFADLDYAYVYLDETRRWTINIDSRFFNGKEKYIGGRGRWYDDSNPNILPIGPLRIEVRLKNGESATYIADIPAPGSTTALGYSTIHSEDVASPPASSAPMLPRATLGLNASLDVQTQSVSIPFSVNDGRVYNGRVFFRDASYNDIGLSPLFVNPQTGLPNSQYLGTTSFHTDGTTNTVTYSSSDIQFEAAKSFSDISSYYVVLNDGAQYGLQSNGSLMYDCLSFSDAGSLLSAPQTPTADAGSDANAIIGQTTTLSGSTNIVSGASYSWVLTSAPPGSTSILAGSSTSTPSFVPDKPGAYRFSLQVTSNGVTSPSDEVIVYAYTRRYSGLPGNIVAIEYDKVHNRLVIACSDPNRLVLFNPQDGTSHHASLSSAPTCLAITTDGNQAAVGHDRYLSIADISTASPVLMAGYPVPDNGWTFGNLKSIVFDNRGYVYCFPGSNQWISLRQVKASDGTQKFIAMNRLYAGAIARLHPSNNSIYYTDAAVSPPCLHWVSIANPDFTVGNDIDDTAQGGSYWIWFNETGSMLIAGTGLIYSITESGNSDTDMTDLGSIASVVGIYGIKWLDHRAHAAMAAGTSLFAAIARQDYMSWGDSTPNTLVYLIDATSFGLLKSIDLPIFIQNGVSTRAHGYYNFWSSTGDELYVVVKSDGAADQQMYDLVVY